MMIQPLNSLPQIPDKPNVLLDLHDHVACLTLSRPKARNALSLAMMSALSQALDSIAGNPSVACVVLAGEGPAFCAGHDLRELTVARANPDGGRTVFEETMAACGALMQQIVALPQPVIAAIEGVATAAGCQLVATCDLAIASEGAHFCTPGVDIGLFCSTPAVALTRALAPKHAMEMLLTGELIAAADAHRIGLVNRVVGHGQALAAAMALAGRIAAKSPSALRFGKAGVRAQAGLPLDEAYGTAGRTMVANLLDRDAREGIAAFLDKRAPQWHHPDEAPGGTDI